MSGIRRLIVEIHRRSLWQVVLIYVGGAWACYEIIDTVTDRLALPTWLPVLAIIFFLLGLPLVLASAFVRESAAESAVSDEGRMGSRGLAAEGLQALSDRRRLAARRRLLTWRNLGLAFVAVLAAWGAVAAGWLVLGGRAEGDGADKGSTATVSATRVAVLPFAVTGNEQLGYLGEGMVHLLSTALDGAGELRVVDPYALLRFLKSERDGPLDPETGEAIASRFGAGRFVLGSVIEAGGRLQVNASLYNADRRVEVSAEEKAEDEGEVFDLVNNVARQLLAAGAGGPSARLTRVAAATTSSLPALKAFLEGEREQRAARFSAAASAYQRAIEADSSFALAWYRLAVATLFAPNQTGASASEAAAQAVHLGDRLSQHDRDRLAVVYALLNGDAEEGERRVRAILRSYPEDMEAWYLLGDFLFHFAGRRGRSIEEAGDAFERALQYDPNLFATLLHLSWIRSIQHRYADVESLAERMVELERASDYRQFSGPVLAFLQGGQPAFSKLLPEMGNASGASLWFGAFRLALLDEGLPAAVEVADLLTDPSRSDYERGTGYAWQATYEAAQGRLRAAAAALDRWERQELPLQFETPLETRAAIWLSPFLPVEREELERLRVELLELDYDTVYAPVTRAYLLGLVNARLGRPAETLRLAARLESDATAADEEVTSRSEKLAWYFASMLRAQVAHDAGDAQEALRLLGQAQAEDRWAITANSLLLSQAHERYLRARALEALGRDEEALDWYASLGWAPAEIFYVAPALQRSAEIYERLGDAEKAASAYRRFITRWRNCDPKLRPAVAEAERALLRLSG